AVDDSRLERRQEAGAREEVADGELLRVARRARGRERDAESGERRPGESRREQPPAAKVNEHRASFRLEPARVAGAERRLERPTLARLSPASRGALDRFSAPLLASPGRGGRDGVPPTRPDRDHEGREDDSAPRRQAAGAPGDARPARERGRLTGHPAGGALAGP